jgi:hypothetical protein
MRLQQYSECILMAVIALASVIGCTRCTPEATDPPARGLALSLSIAGIASNCRTASDGAGATSSTITLVHTGGGCAPVTFVRARGTTIIGSYQVDCSSPPTASCIETDETLSVSDIAPGSYTVHARSSLNGIDCWFNDDVFTVPSKGQLLRRLVLTPQGSCPQLVPVPMQFSGAP